MANRANTRQSGFTLIELIVVMAVLTVLAGLILPKLDLFKDKANNAAGASNVAGLDRFVTAYKVQKDLFPDFNDSLLTSGSNNLYTKLDPNLTGSQTGAPTRLTTTTITNTNELRSLQRVGLTSVLDHNASAQVPGDSAATSTPRALAVSDTVATINSSDTTAQAILRHLYPDTNGVVPATEKVVVFGCGPRNQLVPNTLLVAPFYANTDQNSFYNRYLLVYALQTNGDRARFLGTLGADGSTISDAINGFYSQR